MTDDLPPVRAFGVWDAPATDDAVWIDVPLDHACMYCRERFQPGDNGAIFPTGYAGHRECCLRSAMGGIGHLVNHALYCGGELGPDAGLTYRQSALLVWRHWTGEGPPMTGEELAKRVVINAARLAHGDNSRA